MRTVVLVLTLVMLSVGMAWAASPNPPGPTPLQVAMASPPPPVVGAGAAALLTKGPRWPVALSWSFIATQKPSVPVAVSGLLTPDGWYGGAITIPLSTISDPITKALKIKWSVAFERDLQGVDFGPCGLTDKADFSHVQYGVLLKWDALVF